MAQLSLKEFLESSAGSNAKAQLQQMSQSTKFDTRDLYDVANGRKQTFTDRHINYLVKHPYINPLNYVANLKAMTRTGR